MIHFGSDPSALVVTPVLLITNPALVVTRLGGKLGDLPLVVTPRLCLPHLGGDPFLVTLPWWPLPANDVSLEICFVGNPFWPMRVRIWMRAHGELGECA